MVDLLDDDIEEVPRVDRKIYEHHEPKIVTKTVKEPIPDHIKSGVKVLITMVRKQYKKKVGTALALLLQELETFFA